MNTSDIIRLRLHHQQLVKPRFKSPGEVVRWFGAMQAQDYLHTLWGIGQRLQNVKEADIERAIVEKSFVRTWPMRGTLHFVPSEDVRWMLQHLTPRVVNRQHAMFLKAGLDKSVFRKSGKIIGNALQGGQILSREALYAILKKNKIATSNVRGLHILFVLAQQQLICFGPRQGKQHTFTLLDEWIPATREISFEEALGKLARSYLRSHGPATMLDLAWWAGLNQKEAKAAMESVRPEFIQETVLGKEYWFSPDSPSGKSIMNTANLMSVYDEYGIAYKDRSALVERRRAEELKDRDFLNMVMIKGQIGGFWKRTLVKKKVAVDVSALAPFSISEKKVLGEEVKRYGRFLSLEPQLKIDGRLFQL